MPVALSRIWTFALGTAAPVLSVTLPSRVAETACPRESGGSRRTKEASTAINSQGVPLRNSRKEHLCFCITASEGKTHLFLKSFVYELQTNAAGYYQVETSTDQPIYGDFFRALSYCAARASAPGSIPQSALCGRSASDQRVEGTM